MPCGLRISGLAGAFAALASMQACRPAPPPAATRPAAPRRIVCISPSATETIGELGQADRLVGVCTFCRYPAEVARLPRVGGLFDPNLELILKLQPDLLILRGRNTSVERLCRESGIELYQDRTETFADIVRTLHDLAGRTDCRARAEEVERRLRWRLDRIEAALRGRPRPRVFLSVARKPDSLAQIMTASRSTFVHEVVERAGGVNVYAGLAIDYPEISPESVLAAQPDVIVEVMPEVTLTAERRDQIVELWRKLGPMPATRDNRVYLTTDENLLIPSPRIVESIARLAKLLHPEAPID